MVAQEILESIKDDAPVTGVWVGLHWTVVALADGRAGMASTLQTAHSTKHADPDVAEAGRLHTMSARALADYTDGRQGPEASIGWAALNALVSDALDPAQYAEVEMDAVEFLLEAGKARPLAVIGHFPFTRRLRENVETLWVLEKKPGPGDLSADRTPDILPQAGVVAITSMSLVNNTFQEIIPHLAPGATVMMLGPSTPLTPVLFERGIDVLSGVRLADIDAVRESVTQAASFRQVCGARKVTITPDISQRPNMLS